jgi:hypothetical protein
MMKSVAALLAGTVLLVGCNDGRQSETADDDGSKPLVSFEANDDGVNVNAPGVNVQTDDDGTTAEAPGVRVDTDAEGDQQE